MSLTCRVSGEYYSSIMISGIRVSFNTGETSLEAATKIENTVKKACKTYSSKKEIMDYINSYLKKPTNIIPEVVPVKNLDESFDQNTTFLSVSDKCYKHHFSKLKTPKIYLNFAKVIDEGLKTILSKEHPTIFDLTPGNISEVRLYIFERFQVSDSTVNRYMAYLKKMLNICYKEFCIIQSVPYIKITKEVRNRQLVYSDNDEKIIAKHLAENIKYHDLLKMFILGLDTGFRLGEMINLTPESFCFNSKTISLSDPTKVKDKDTRIVPMTDRVYTMFKDITEKPFNFCLTTYCHRFRKILDSLGYTDKDYGFHVCRHTYATRLLNGKVSVYDVSKLLGHSDIKTTERYLHTNHERLLSAVNVLNNRS